jgi:hypothetical protein
MRWRDPIKHILTLFKKLDHFIIAKYISIALEWPSLQRECRFTPIFLFRIGSWFKDID